MGGIKSFVNHAINNVVSVSSQIATGGIVKYDPGTGKLGAGPVGRGIDEGMGELTGRNQLRAMMHLEEKKIADEQAQRAKEQQDALTQQKQDDYAASFNAAAITGTAMYTPGMRVPKLGQTPNSQQDFLGL
jgi:hypothetical protein